MPDENTEVTNVGGTGAELPEHFRQETFTKKLDEHPVFLLKCPGCGKVHFRHAGYVEILIPHVSAKEGNKVADHAEPVKVCVNCKHAIIFHDGKVIDVTDQIDLKAWTKTEEEAYEATGPGGQC